eukprot:556109-Pyramimonas_sp.AAC.1
MQQYVVIDYIDSVGCGPLRTLHYGGCPNFPAGSDLVKTSRAGGLGSYAPFLPMIVLLLALAFLCQSDIGLDILAGARGHRSLRLPPSLWQPGRIFQRES